MKKKVFMTNFVEPAVILDLATLKQLLELEGADNLKYREHVQMLVREVDAMKDIIVSKQNAIVKVEQEISFRDESIRKLQMELNILSARDAKCEALEAENVELMVRYEAKDQEVADLRVESEALKKSHAEQQVLWQRDKQQSAKMDAVRLANIIELQGQLKLERAVKEGIEKHLASIHTHYEKFSDGATVNHDLETIKISRCRDAMYRAQLKADNLSLLLVNACDERDKTTETLSLAVRRGDLLEQRLNEACKDFDKESKTYEAVISDLQGRLEQSQERELQVIKENELLNMHVGLSKSTVNDLACIVESERRKRIELAKELDESQCLRHVSRASRLQAGGVLNNELPILSMSKQHSATDPVSSVKAQRRLAAKKVIASGSQILLPPTSKQGRDRGKAASGPAVR